MVLFKHKQPSVSLSYLFISLAVQGLESLMDSWVVLSQWLCYSFRSHFEQSKHSVIAVRQQSLKVQELPKAAGQHVAWLLVAPLHRAGHEDLETSMNAVSNILGFLPGTLNFNDLELYEESARSHSVNQEMVVTPTGSINERHICIFP